MHCQNAATFPCPWGQWREKKCWKASGKRLDSSNTAYLQDGNSDPEKSDWTPVSSLKASGDLESKTSSLKIMNYPSGRICQLQNCSSCSLTMNSSITPVDLCYRSRFLYCFLYWSVHWQDKAQLYNFKLEVKCWGILHCGPWKSCTKSHLFFLQSDQQHWVR